MKLTEYLFRRIFQLGTKKIFGIPGDFALPLFQTLNDLEADVVTFTHEPALGYAADAYARLNGFAVAVVTYGAGGLNMVNAIAQAYAEKSPVLVVSGAPEIFSRRKNLIIHHCVKNFESQKRVYDEVCCVSTILDKLDEAILDIDYTIQKILAQNRPGYLEIPRDIGNYEIAVPEKHFSTPFVEIFQKTQQPQSLATDSELNHLKDLIQTAKRPLLYLGVEIRRLGLEKKAQELVEKLNLPFTTSMEGKAVIPETHKNFIGTYMGFAGPEKVREEMLNSDLIINIGTLMSDVNLGMFSDALNLDDMIHITTEGLTLKKNIHFNINISQAMDFLIQNCKKRENTSFESYRFPIQTNPEEKDITTDKVVNLINAFVKKHDSVIVLDVGDILFASNHICADVLLSPSFYASMGFAIPATVSACLSLPKHKTITLVGDGAFLMTGTEIGTIMRHKLSPIIIVLNNKGYLTMKKMDDDKGYYDIPACDFVKFAESFNMKSEQANTIDELEALINKHTHLDQAVLIEANMSKNSASQSLQKMSEANLKFRNRKN